MNYLVWLVPIALGMGLFGLLAFLWSMRSGQYEDLDGAAERVLLADAAEAPLHNMKLDDGGLDERSARREPRSRRKRSLEERV
jgi:cbb3-type cytochrome oxidase maturation protein